MDRQAYLYPLFVLNGYLIKWLFVLSGYLYSIVICAKITRCKHKFVYRMDFYYCILIKNYILLQKLAIYMLTGRQKSFVIA